MSIVPEKAALPKPETQGVVENSTIESSGDIEASSGTDDEAAAAVARLEELGRLYGATWDSPSDPADPYNWSSTKKVTIGIVMSLGALVTLIGASVVAPAIPDITRDLGLSPAAAQIAFSVYFLGLAFSPFPIAAISEMNGRRNIWIVSNLWFILWNTLCPVGYSKGLMITGRFLAATGAAAGNLLTGPVMADMFGAQDRGKSLAIAAFLPYLGPALGPIIGGAVSDLVSWPYLFYIVSIVNAMVLLIGVIFIKESYTPTLLRRKAARIHSRGTAQQNKPTKPSELAFWRTLFSDLGVNLIRPVHVLIRRPVTWVVCLNLAVDFEELLTWNVSDAAQGIYTLVLSTFSSLWIDQYHRSSLSSSLHYIAITVGITIATQDAAQRAVSSRRLPEGKPEYRVPYMIPSVLLVPAGLFWYGWAAEFHYHFIVVDIGVAVFAAGSFAYTQAMSAYIYDEFGRYAASATAAQRVLGQTFGFAFPIFAPQLYSNLGYGWANSLLAFVFIGIAFPVPICLWLWGEKLRALGRSRTA
ncbi:MFS general substrate transporter [Xylariaceae sp. FL0255]|nr:MFS general substrate transporter [Xylariaceae sp. FL0255]